MSAHSANGTGGMKGAGRQARRTPCQGGWPRASTPEGLLMLSLKGQEQTLMMTATLLIA